MTERCDVLVTHGCVLTLDGARTIYADGAVAIQGRDIVAVGRSRDVAARFAPTRTIDAGGAIVHPGFVEGHYHTTMHLTRAAITDDPSRPAVGGAAGATQRAIYSEWTNFIDDADEHASASLALLEMAKAGYTCFTEPGTAFEPDIVAKAAQALGVRGSVADPYLWDRAEGMQMATEIDRAPCDLGRALALMGGELKRNADPDALVRGHIGVYGSGSASVELIRAAKDMAERNNVAFTQHQSFMPEAAAREKAAYGKSPLVHFAELGLLGPNVALTHMNALDDDEIEVVAASGTKIVWHPGNFMFYGLGARCAQRMPELHAKGVSIALGNDIAKLWAFGDLPFLAYLIARNHGHFVSAESVLEMATLGGARALGWQDIIGSLEPGKRADLVIRKAELAEAVPGVSPAFEAVLVQRAKGVDTVICDGKVIVAGGRSTRVDEGAILAQARASARRLMAKTGLSTGAAWPVVN